MNKQTICLIVFAISTTLSIVACHGQKSSEHDPKKIGSENLANTPTNHEKTAHDALQNIYSRAISDYITEVNQQNIMVLDTLFFGKRNNGQPDDFPDIALPETIKNVNIQLIDPELGKKLQREKKSRVYINLVGWVEDQQSDFIFVTFSNGFEHKFDYHVEYQYNPEQKDYNIKTSRIEVFNK